MLTTEEIQIKYDECKKELADKKIERKLTEKCSAIYSNWRNAFLIAGFILILASKVIQPYFAN